MAYLTYTEYTTLGGKLDESTFNYIEPKAEMKIGYYTFNRITEDNEEDITPLKPLVRDLVDLLESASKKDANVKSYSNGIESYSYNDIKATTNAEIRSLVIEYLSGYPELLYRGVFNV